MFGNWMADNKVYLDSVTVQPIIIKNDTSNPDDPATDTIGTNYEEDATLLRLLGIMDNYTDKLFKGDFIMTREEFVKFIVLGLGLKLTEETDMDFPDVDRNAWYRSYVLSAASSGVVFGRGDGTFGIGDKITREDMAVMICRALSSKGISITAAAEPGFSDAEYISDYAAEAVSFLSEKGILHGLDDGSFAPKSFSTRAQVAVVICRTIDFLKGDV